MYYLGGKARIAKALAAEIAKHRRPGQPVWEPFCGGLNSAVAHGGVVHCTDACVPLIALLQAVRDGWDPPATLVWEKERPANLRGKEKTHTERLYLCRDL